MGLSEKYKDYFKFDKVILIIILLLMVVSVIEVYSATSWFTHGQANFMSPLKSHIINCFIGLFVMFVVFCIPYNSFKIINKFIIMPVSLIMLGILAIKGMTADTPQRSIDLGFMNFQASELAKIGLILYIARELEILPSNIEEQKPRFYRMLCCTIVFCLMIIPENLSTGLLLGFMVFVMMWVGHVDKKYLLSLLGVVLLLASVAILLFKTIPPEKMENLPVLSRTTTWQARVLDYSNKGDEQSENTPQEYFMKIAPDKPQETRANIAIASSNILGKGPGNSDQREYLREASNDFMFAIIVEELGLVPAIFVIAAYLALLYRIVKQVRNCKAKFPAYVLTGIGVVMFAQTMINMLVAVGSIPVTGQSLPFITRGGSSILIYSVMMALVLNISRENIAQSDLARSNADTGDNASAEYFNE